MVGFFLANILFFEFNLPLTSLEMADLGAVSTAAGSETDRAQRVLPSGVPVAVRKQNAEGLEEKFGKFTVPSSSQQNRRRSCLTFISDFT